MISTAGDVGTLYDRHGGRWQVLAQKAGAAPPTWHARPWGSGQGFEGWDGPGVLTAGSAGELDALLEQADG